MSEFALAEDVLKKMLSTLGFEVDVAFEVSHDGPCMQIQSEQSSILIGKNGDRLEDIQYLVNRIAQKHDAKLPRVKVDCDHYRENQEEQLLEKVRSLAEKVRADGRPARTRPLNAYYRRLVHNAFIEDSEIETTSPDGNSRFKRVLISKKES